MTDMLDTKTSTPFAVVSASVNLEQVPVLIAAYLPVEICVYYQVVPVNLDGTLLILGMVDPNDLAALDYVGKMLEFSKLQIHAHPVSFQEHQELIAHYFSNPPDPASIVTLKEAAAQLTAAGDEQSEALFEAEALPEEEDAAAEANPEPLEQTESDAEIKRLLNSVLRRALEEKADRVFVEINEDRTCRIRYRQKGILRDLFKDLSDAVGVKLIVQLKRMVGVAPDEVLGDREAEAERVFRGEPLVFQLRIVPQKGREGAILTIVQGVALAKYQKQRNSQRVAEVAALSVQTGELLTQLQHRLTDTIAKVREYSKQPDEHWAQLADSLEDLVQRAKQVETLHHEWVDVQNAKESS
ncbi:MAG: hypothetical protein AAFX40_12940 [Cyanobacteria bacterium J06639_1]